MKTLSFIRHFGRLGNNMVYIINSIEYCLKYGFNKINIGESVSKNNKKHYVNILLISNIIDINNADNNECNNEDTCGYRHYNAFIPFYKRRENAQLYLVPKLKITPQIIDKDALVIHIRGGDVFKRGHKAYVQPPLSYYEKIIKSRSWSKIYLISEDTCNPCFNIIKNNYNCISFLDMKLGFENDLSIMLGATNFVTSKSSLSPLIIQLNSNIKNVYVADYFLCINEKSSNYSKKEDIIWWSNDICKNEEFKDKNIFEYHGITFNIIDCCNFINKINDKNYDLSKSQNRQLLIDN